MLLSSLPVNSPCHYYPMGWKHKGYQISPSQVTYSHSWISCRTTFLLTILEPLSFLLTLSTHCTVHHLFLVCCINHSFSPVGPASIKYSFLYQTFANAARATAYKYRARIPMYPLVRCFTKSKSNSSTHTSVIYFQSLSIFICHHSLGDAVIFYCIDLITHSCICLPS